MRQLWDLNHGLEQEGGSNVGYYESEGAEGSCETLLNVFPCEVAILSASYIHLANRRLEVDSGGSH